MSNTIPCQRSSLVKHLPVSNILPCQKSSRVCQTSFRVSNSLSWHTYICLLSCRTPHPCQTSFRLKRPPTLISLQCHKSTYALPCRNRKTSRLKHPPVSDIVPCHVGKAHRMPIHLYCVYFTSRRVARSSSGRVTLSSQLCINMPPMPHNNTLLCMPHPSPETLYIISLAFLDPELCTSASVFDVSSLTALRTKHFEHLVELL